MRTFFLFMYIHTVFDLFEVKRTASLPPRRQLKRRHPSRRPPPWPPLILPSIQLLHLRRLQWRNSRPLWTTSLVLTWPLPPSPDPHPTSGLHSIQNLPTPFLQVKILYIRMYVYVDMCVCVCGYVCVCMWICVCVYTHANICIFTLTAICIYVYMHSVCALYYIRTSVWTVFPTVYLLQGSAYCSIPSIKKRKAWYS